MKSYLKEILYDNHALPITNQKINTSNFVLLDFYNHYLKNIKYFSFGEKNPNKKSSQKSKNTSFRNKLYSKPRLPTL